MQKDTFYKFELGWRTFDVECKCLKSMHRSLTKEPVEIPKISWEGHIFKVALQQFFGTTLVEWTVSVLFVLPSTVQAVYDITDHPHTNAISHFAIFLSYLNSFNMVAMFIYRQRDARTTTAAAWRKVCRRSKHPVKMIATTTIVSRQSQPQLFRARTGRSEKTHRKSVAFWYKMQWITTIADTHADTLKRNKQESRKEGILWLQEMGSLKNEENN